MSLQRFSSVHRPTMSLGEEKPSTISNEHRAGLARLGRSLSVGESTARGRVLRRSFSRSWISPVRGRDKECGNRHEMRRDPEEPKHQDVCPQTVKQDEPTGWSAEDIARRKFKSMLTMGPGLPVLKHNRNKGRSRRVLSFDAKVGKFAVIKRNDRNFAGSRIWYRSNAVVTLLLQVDPSEMRCFPSISPQYGS